MEQIRAIPERFKVVSLFSGGGGSSTGYRMAGGKTYIASEFVPLAADTYEANWPDTKVLRTDIRETDASEFEIGCEIDLLDGSPPCSAFSTAGKISKLWGQEKSYSDTTQARVEDLFFEYIRVLGHLQPRAFIAENVSGLIKGKSKGYFKTIYRGLEACGYEVRAAEVNSKHFEVPQSRPRVIFVGIRKDLYNGQTFYPEPIIPIVRAGEAIADIVHHASELEEVDMTKNAIYQRLIKLKMGEKDVVRFNLIKAHPDLPCPTITSHAGNKGAAGVKHWENRCFTVKEYKRLFTVPDDYTLLGNYYKQGERLGRMVPCFMSKGLANNLLQQGVFNGNS